MNSYLYIEYFFLHKFRKHYSFLQKKVEKRRKGEIWVSSLIKANSESQTKKLQNHSLIFYNQTQTPNLFFHRKNSVVFSTWLLRNGKRWQFRQEGIEITPLVTSQKRTTQFHELAIFFYSLDKKKTFLGGLFTKKVSLKCLNESIYKK